MGEGKPKIAVDLDDGIRTLLFGDYPWNQAETLPPNVVRVTNWDEVCRVLLGRA